MYAGYSDNQWNQFILIGSEKLAKVFEVFIKLVDMALSINGEIPQWVIYFDVLDFGRIGFQKVSELRLG